MHDRLLSRNNSTSDRSPSIGGKTETVDDRTESTSRKSVGFNR